MARRHVVSVLLLYSQFLTCAFIRSNDVHSSRSEERQHYTILGFSSLDNADSRDGLFRQRWIIHALVDENRHVVDHKFFKSKRNRNRRTLGVLDMKEVSVSRYLYLFIAH